MTRRPFVRTRRSPERGRPVRFGTRLGLAAILAIGTAVAVVAPTPAQVAAASTTTGAVTAGAASGVMSTTTSATTTGADTGSSTAAAQALAPLQWAPPALESPTTVRVSATKRLLKLDLNKDYIIQMPAQPLNVIRGLVIWGGRNVVLIGGEINIPVEGLTAENQGGRGLYLSNQTGTVHVEGLKITGAGLEEGINLDQRRGAVVQLQNIRVETVQGSYSSAHADVLQTWAGPRQLLIDGLTGYTQYQGMFLLPTQQWSGGTQPELFDLRRVDLRGTPTSAYMLWRDGASWPMNLKDVWVSPKNPSDRNSYLWPKGTTAPGTAAWPSVKVGTPPAEFVPDGAAGLAYQSPGYVVGVPTTPAVPDPGSGPAPTPAPTTPEVPVGTPGPTAPDGTAATPDPVVPPTSVVTPPTSVVTPPTSVVTPPTSVVTPPTSVVTPPPVIPPDPTIAVCYVFDGQSAFVPADVAAALWTEVDGISTRLDDRSGITAGSPVTVQVTGSGGVPIGATAVLVRVSAVGIETGGRLGFFRAEDTVVGAPMLTVPVGDPDTTVLAPLSDDGRLTYVADVGPDEALQVVLDVIGYSAAP